MRKNDLKQLVELYNYLNTVPSEEWNDDQRKMKSELDKLMAVLDDHATNGVMIAQDGANLIRDMATVWDRLDSVIRKLDITHESRLVWQDKTTLDDFFARLELDLEEDFPEKNPKIEAAKERIRSAGKARLDKIKELARENSNDMADAIHYATAKSLAPEFKPGIEQILKTPKVEPEESQEVPVDEQYQEILKLMPADFAYRMSTDEWFFGFLLATGDIMAFSSIRQITRDANGEIWIDVNMLGPDDVDVVCNKNIQKKILPLPTSRNNVSVNSRNIVATFELADT